MRELVKLHESGQFDQMLPLLQRLFKETESAKPAPRVGFFMVMFQWSLLAEVYPPSLPALAELRDEQLERLHRGDLYPGLDTSSGDPAPPFGCESRFSLICQMNEILGDSRSGYELLLRLQAEQPALASKYAHRLLPAVLDVGDFALADRYRGEPLACLNEINESARILPLFPAARTAPRLAAELSNLARDVRIGMATLRGLGRETESTALREALLTGLESGELRTWAARELEAHGTITREVVRRQADEEGMHPATA